MLLSGWIFKLDMLSHHYRLSRYTALLLCTVLLCLACARAMAADGVTVLVSAASAPGSGFVEEFRRELAQANSRLPINVVVLDNQAAVPAIDTDDIVVAVGVQALLQASKLDNKIPLMAVLVPRPSFDKILLESKRSSRNTSAIVLDQPYARQLALVKTVLPNATRLGVLLGPSSLDSKKELEQAALQQGITLLYATVNNPYELSSGLKQLMESSEALWAIPDPIVYSRETVQAILLTTYRYQKPVFGFSQAYVRAGALAAIHSTPQQIAKQLAEELAALSAKSKSSLPGVRYPRYFSVDVNLQVGQSLGVDVSNDVALSDLLTRTER